MSDAEPLKVTACPLVNVVPLAGWLIETLGAVFGMAFTTMVMLAEPGVPWVSVTAAVMTWVPTARSVRLNEPPVPSAP